MDAVSPVAENDSIMERLCTLVEPWRWLTDPVFRGLERVPEGTPLFLVGNHTLMGAFDVPLLMAGLWKRKGIEIHALGDHLHYQIPGWRDLVSGFGVIEGTRENCRQAMKEGKSLMVFPGGGREVTKRRNERYKLLWGDRIGFARLAIEGGYTVLPTAAVGADDCWDLIVDGDDIMKSPLKGLIERYHPRPDFLPPLIRGIGLTPLPRPERFYFYFGEPIPTDTDEFRGCADDDAVCRELRDRVRASVEEGLALLLEERENDPERSFATRLARDLRRLVPGASGG